MQDNKQYPARLEIEYPKTLDKVSTFFRLLLALPIVILLSLLSGYGGDFSSQDQFMNTSAGIAGGLSVATALMIIFRQSYPKWWYTFALELERFSYRVGAYVFLLTDKYPSTVEKQSVKLDVEYPDVEKDLNRWLPLVKWFMAIPHYFVLFFLSIAAVVATVIAWFAILFTGQYPKDLFDFVVGVGRWSLRVSAYAFLLTTDEYPPFSLK